MNLYTIVYLSIMNLYTIVHLSITHCELVYYCAPQYYELVYYCAPQYYELVYYCALQHNLYITVHISVYCSGEPYCLLSSVSGPSPFSDASKTKAMFTVRWGVK